MSIAAYETIQDPISFHRQYISDREKAGKDVREGASTKSEEIYRVSYINYIKAVADAAIAQESAATQKGKVTSQPAQQAAEKGRERGHLRL